MTTDRLEAFSDGVVAILITIMVLEFKAPHSADLTALKPLIPTALSYVLSFLYIGIYWNNHHQLMHASDHVSGGVLWANLHLMFWLSVTPFVTAWMGETSFASGPVAAYGFVLTMNAVAYTILTLTLIKANGPDSAVAKGLGADYKGRISLVIYISGVVLAGVQHYVSCALYALVALMWLVPDKRFAAHIEEKTCD